MGAPMMHAFAPGRTEIAGNHTDHEGGHVIAAAIDRGIRAEIWRAGEGPEGTFGRSCSDAHVRIASDGFAPIVIDLAAPNTYGPRAEEVGTAASLVRGMLAGLCRAGVALGGFDAHFSSTLPAGSGLSSSAAFELLVGVIVNGLYADGRLGGSELARMGQRAEAEFFGKPCGLMDQLAVASGGVCAFDFSDPEAPQADILDCDFADMGLAVVLVDVGCDHSRFTDEYNAVPADMQAVARLCGARRLCEVAEKTVLARSELIRSDLGDRALLRAMHFYREERLTAARVDALRAGDAVRFLGLTRASGASSAMFLQNVSAPGNDQPAMVALAIAQALLDGEEGGAGAARIHGGGFGGSIQAFVPVERADAFVEGMDGLLGDGSCLCVKVGVTGASAAMGG